MQVKPQDPNYQPIKVLKPCLHDTIVPFEDAKFDVLLKEIRKEYKPIVWAKPLLVLDSELTFGKHKGMTIRELLKIDRKYLIWAVKEDIIKPVPALKKQILAIR